MRNLLRVIFCAVLLVAMALPLAAEPALGSPSPALPAGGEQHSAWDELEVWVAGILIGFIDFVQSVSPMIVLAAAFAGVGVFLLGALLGNKILKGAGGSAVLAAIAAYLAISNAPAIILLIQGWRIE